MCMSVNETNEKQNVRSFSTEWAETRDISLAKVTRELALNESFFLNVLIFEELITELSVVLIIQQPSSHPSLRSSPFVCYP